MGAKAATNDDPCVKPRRSTSSTIRKIGDHRFFRWSAIAARPAAGAAHALAAGTALIAMRRPFVAGVRIIGEKSLHAAVTLTRRGATTLALATQPGLNSRWPCAGEQWREGGAGTAALAT